MLTMYQVIAARSPAVVEPTLPKSNTPLVVEAGDADGVIGSLATNDQQVGVVSDGVLEVAAIAATPADAAALGEEGDEANGAARDVWPIERGDVIEQRGFTMNGFGDFVFGVTAEDDVVFVAGSDNGGGANFEARDGRVGASAFRGVEGAENLRAQSGVGDERLGFGGEAPRRSGWRSGRSQSGEDGD